MTVPTPPPPPLPDELDRLLRRLRLPYVRRAAPDVIATAASQRWEHAEVLRVLLAEEAAGRDKATTSMRRKASGLPAGKTFDAWEPGRVRDPSADAERAPDARVGRPHEVLVGVPARPSTFHTALLVRVIGQRVQSRTLRPESSGPSAVR